MLIDFRTRPPYKSEMNTVIFQDSPACAPENMSIFDIGKEPIPSKQQKSMDLFMQELDETETELAVIMGRKADDNGEVDNDETYELMQKYPGRFIGFAGINPLQAGQVEEIERCAALGFRGIGLDVAWLRKQLMIDDTILDPIYETCQRLGMIASITCSFMLGDDFSFSKPDLIWHVAAKFPKLNIVVPHACWPHVNYALAMAIRCPNVYLMPDCYVYIPGFPMSEEYVNAANGYLKYRTIYCSTYPVRSLKQAKEGWMQRNFTKDALEHTMYLNAKRLLSL